MIYDQIKRSFSTKKKITTPRPQPKKFVTLNKTFYSLTNVHPFSTWYFPLKFLFIGGVDFEIEGRHVKNAFSKKWLIRIWGQSQSWSDSKRKLAGIGYLGTKLTGSATNIIQETGFGAKRYTVIEEYYSIFIVTTKCTPQLMHECYGSSNELKNLCVTASIGL